MNITAIKYTNADETNIAVSSMDTLHNPNTQQVEDVEMVRYMPYPVNGQHVKYVDDWLISNAITPYKTAEQLLADAKAAMRVAIETERDIRKFSNVSYNSVEYEADAWTITMIQQLLADARATSGASLPVTPFWRAADNTMVTLTLQDLEGLNQAIQLSINTAYVWSWTKKAAVDAATTVAEVETITLE